MVVDPLTGLAMWKTWQDQVVAALPQYAASPWYLEQDSLTPEAVDQTINTIGIFRDVDGMARDVAHGATPFETRIGTVTRAWVDGNIEINFLRRALPVEAWRSLHVLDIGAGYGRLAVMLARQVKSYTCVDPVPVSVEVCREYTQRYAPSVRVLDVPAFRRAMEEETIRPTLAINIHSWNECSYDQIAAWLDVLQALGVPWLFTVSHEQEYRTWGGEPSFRPLLEARYDLMIEESLGVQRCPHALWQRRGA